MKKEYDVMSDEELYYQYNQLENEKSDLVSQKEKGIRELEETDYAMSVRSKQLAELLQDFGETDTKINQYIYDCQDTIMFAQKRNLESIDTIEEKVKKRYCEIIGEQEKISICIQKMQEENKEQ